MSARDQANQADQAAPYTLRPGWENEPIAVPPPWRWMALAPRQQP